MLVITRNVGQAVLIGKQMVTLLGINQRDRFASFKAEGVEFNVRGGEEFPLMPGVTLKVRDLTARTLSLGITAPMSVKIARSELLTHEQANP